jgi:HAD-superfamily phosphatase, subfamily IIIC/FkbH-like domain
MKKIAILSNVTVNMIADKLKGKAEVYIPAGFDTWQQEIFHPESELNKCCFDAIFVILYCNPYSNEWLVSEMGEEALNTWYVALRSLAEKSNTPIFVSDLCTQDMQIRSMKEMPAFESLKHKWRQLLSELDRTYLFPITELAGTIGTDNFYSGKMWYLSTSPFSIKANKLIANEIAECLDRIFMPRKKCLAIDLDNTIWGGVVGEDGMDGIQLSNHNEGSRYYNAQILLKEMQKKGVMLAIVSKNNVEDVDEVFRKHPYLVLKHEDFVAEKINWNAKSDNLMQLAKELNIGLDSFVFLDDNPAEREEVRAGCPEVEVANFPEDTTLLPKTIKEIYDRYFKSLETTKEDTRKTEQYRKNAKRQEIKNKAAGLDGYLKELEITAKIHLMKDGEMNRVVQLVGKTNQFNLATTRYSSQEVMSFLSSDKSDIVVAQVEDKFGDEGLVAVIFIRYDGDMAYIDDFLMSCRVMGRNLEKVMIAEVCQWIGKTRHNIQSIIGRYIKSPKNSPVEYLYDGLGFELVSEDSELGIKMYRTDIEGMNIKLPPYKRICAFGKEKEQDA